MSRGILARTGTDRLESTESSSAGLRASRSRLLSTSDWSADSSEERPASTWKLYYISSVAGPEPVGAGTFWLEPEPVKNGPAP